MDENKENKGPVYGMNFDPETGEQINPYYTEDANLKADGDEDTSSEASINADDEKSITSFESETDSNESADTSKAESEARSVYEYSSDDKNDGANSDNKEKAKKEKKPMGTGKKFGLTISLAAVFGLVAGGVFCGVSYGGSKILGTSNTAVESIESAATSGSDASASESTSQKSESTSSKTTYLDTSDSNSTGTDEKGTVSEVAQNCMPSLVTIASVSVVEMQNLFGQTQQYQSEGAGSGVIVGQNDTELLIATNNHVVEGATSLSVGFIDETSVEAYIKGTDSDNDLAVVAVKLESIPEDTLSQIKVATIGDSDNLVLGEEVVAIGNALGYGQSVTSGCVSALHRSMTFSDNSYTVNQDDLIQTDAPINSGNSGGGLFNMKGELIGINEAKDSVSSSGTVVDGVGFAISISKAEPILENLMTLETKVPVDEENAGYLGVRCADVSSDIASMYNMPEGVCFTSVLKDSPADKAGAKKGDVLIEFDSQTVKDYDDLKNLLKYCAAGDTVTAVVMRSDNGEYEEVTLEITLGTYDEISALESSEQ